MSHHEPSRAFAIVLSLLFFVATLAVNALAASGMYPFLDTLGNVSNAFETQITPAVWTFNIWFLIYAWLSAMLLYLLSSLCRRNVYGHFYCCAPALPHGFFVVWCWNQGFNVGWLFFWDRRLVTVALGFLLAITLSNYILLFFSCHGLHLYGAWLSRHHRVELWLRRLLVQNGLAIYATWTTIASLINLTIVLTLEANMTPANAASVALAALGVILLVWFIMENSILDHHVRYIFIIYPVVIWALSGVFAKNYTATNLTRNDIFVAGLLAFAGCLFAARIIMICYRHTRHPLHHTHPHPLEKEESMTPIEIGRRQMRMFQ